MKTAYKEIINKNKGTILADRAEIANTPFKRLKGLLGKKSLEQGQGLIIVPCNSIHTFFMRFSIDVIFLDNRYQIVALVESLPPARVFSCLLRGKIAIELPSGTLRKTQTFHSDLIEIETVDFSTVTS